MPEPLVEQLQTIVARLLESEQLVAHQKQVTKEIALEEETLSKMRTEKALLTDELKELRAQVSLERRNVEHWKAEMSSLRGKLNIPSEAA
jgi:hypothetical protein